MDSESWVHLSPVPSENPRLDFGHICCLDRHDLRKLRWRRCFSPLGTENVVEPQQVKTRHLFQLGGTSLKDLSHCFHFTLFKIAENYPPNLCFLLFFFSNKSSESWPLHLRRACRSCNFNRKICRSCVRSSRGKPRSQAILPLEDAMPTGRMKIHRIPRNRTLPVKLLNECPVQTCALCMAHRLTFLMIHPQGGNVDIQAENFSYLFPFFSLFSCLLYRGMT